MPKIKNIIIFTAIAAVFVLIYVFFIRSSPKEENLIVSPSTTTLPDMNGSSASTGLQVETPLVAKDFLALLLNVRNIKLDDAILSNPAFLTLRDSSIVLIPDGNEGRPNPFAKFGNDVVTNPVVPTSPISPTSSPITPDPAQP